MSAQSDAVLRIAVDRDNERTHRERAERALRRAQDRLAAVEAERDAMHRGVDTHLAARMSAERKLEAVENLCKSFDPTSGSGRARAFVSDVRVALGAADTTTPQDEIMDCGCQGQCPEHNPLTPAPETAKGHVRPTPQADRRAAELRRTGIPDAMDGPYDPPFRAATEQSCVCYCHRWPSRTSYCWNMGCSCGQIGGPPAESLELKPAPKTVAGLLREVAAADPEGHNARLGRAYGVGPIPEAATEARPEFFHRRPTRGPETVRAPVAPPTPEATDGNISPELLRAGSLPTLTSGGDNDGDIPGRQRAEGHGEHAHGNGEQREGSPVPRVRAEVGADVLQRRDHVRDGLPLVRAREHDDARVAPSGLQRATEQQQ